MIEWLKEWWNGKNINYENDPNSPLIFIGWHNKKHWTSKLAHWIVSLFTNNERRAIFLAVLAFITFIFMVMKFFSSTST